MRLKHTGNGYHGSLPLAEGGTLFCVAGEVVEVSEAKAEQLLADFPKEWVETTEPIGKPPNVAVKEAVPEQEAEEPIVDDDDDGAPAQSRRKKK